ncbi:ComEA family DNA-binding protein [Aeromicrobium sp. IC_218]|uniref:ComEA family DNA-binding protein n=1 Tax=Aeromicrobium sp. IC_218 TaxID=2545468 RepID=UPI00103DD858|nr:ComEA family DNA-binding protein [Aeromicrobium sp. IC_218]TCI97362.1 ComEA family DNA-binding protein [Aeromicrobium sp. IC_218]
MWDDQETRAEVARRRLARLTAEFEQAQARRTQPERPEATPVTPVTPAEPPAPSRLRLSGAHVRVVGVVLTAAAVVTVWWVLAGRPAEHAVPVTVDTPASATPGPDASATPGSAGGAQGAEPGPLVVDVAGKVRRPGIVELPPGSRVVDAIEAAGGVRGRPDTTSLNLARKLVDGEQVLVGVEAAAVPAAPAPGGAAGAGPVPGAVIDLNTATIEQLDTLPGVGPVTAQAILSWREEHGSFTSVDDLLDVKGIGEATLAELRDLVSAG